MNLGAFDLNDSNPGYLILREYKNERDGYSLNSIAMNDAIPIMTWRNQQIDALRQSIPLTSSMQNSYFKKHVEAQFEEQQPNPILLRYCLRDQLIGYGGLVHIDWKERIAEVSFLLETARAQDLKHYVDEFSTFLYLLKNLAFRFLGFQKLTTEAYAHRMTHVSTIENSGFKREQIVPSSTKVEGKWIDSILASCENEEYNRPK